MNEQQIIEAALKDGNMPLAQAAAYRLLLRCAEQLSAMENLDNEEASGGRSAATPSPDLTIEDHCRKMLMIAHDAEIAMEDPEWIASSELVGMANYLNRLFKLSGAKSNKGEAPCSTGNVNFSGPAPESGLDSRVEEISRGHDGVWRAYGRDVDDRLEMLGKSANLADLVGVNELTSADMVREFHRKFGVPIAGSPGFPARERMDLRVRLIAEEFCEFLAACGYKFTVNIADEDEYIFFKSATTHDTDLIAAADGLADMQYVIDGTALEFGIPLAAVFAEVHRSNMTKTGLPDSGGKIAKGDGYGPPQIERILREHGWEG